MISSPGLVLAVRGQKKGGGEGKGEEETRSGKIRLRGSDASTAHALNLTCFHVYSTDIEFNTVLRFALVEKTRTKFTAKTQTLRCFEGCSAAGRHVLAVLIRLDMGKI